MSFRIPLLLILASLLAGCTHANVARNDNGMPRDARDPNNTRAALAAPETGDDDGCFVGLALSGGGSRSAVFSAACMFELQRLGLLQRVDYISSVSGGSLPAAYYCVSTDGWNPAEVERRMSHSFATDVIVQLILPWNFITVLATDWDRSDLLAGSFRKTLFTRGRRELTFADLREDRPRLLINATDLQSGDPFIFCDERFDELNSDLSKYPLSYAVAASAAVPVLMNHVTLRDYSTTFKQYRHLIDGGVNDNLGITALVDTYAAQMSAAAAEGKPSPYPNGAIFIVVDARTRFDARLSDKGDMGMIQTLQMGAGLTSTALVNRASSATLAELIVRHSRDAEQAQTLRQKIQQLETLGHVELVDRHDQPIRVVHLALSHLQELKDLPFQSFHQSVNSIATYFNIAPSEAHNLIKAAQLLVEQKYEPELLRLRHELE